jgi:hypothetical protein
MILEFINFGGCGRLEVSFGIERARGLRGRLKPKLHELSIDVLGLMDV